MNCKDILENLDEYIHNELDKEKTEQIKAHLSSCQSCREEYNQLKSLIDEIRNAYNKIDIPDKLNSISVSNNAAKGNKTKRKLYIKRAVIAVACVFTIVLGIFAVPNFFSTQKAVADEYRGGFTLTPESFDATGVKPDSLFILESKKTISPDAIENSLSIDGEPSPEFIAKDSKTMIIKPSQSLKQNRLYTFRIKREDSYDITWTFQTNTAFKIVGVFPGDKSTNVPLNCGIEIYFSHEDFDAPDDYFEITPKVEGSFERHKKAAVFVPEGLKENTIYTVRLKKGLKLKGTEYSLEEDYVYQFETTGSENRNKYYKGKISYRNTLNEYLPGEKPQIPLSAYFNPDQIKEAVTVTSSVFSYSDMDSFIRDLGKKSKFPAWAQRSMEENNVASDGLKEVMVFEQVLNPEEQSEQFITLPSSLPQGFYLVDSKWEDQSFQTFVQVTEIGMYSMTTDNKMLVWLNDLKDKKPLAEALIDTTAGNKSFSTDKEGIAVFDNEFDRNSQAKESKTIPSGSETCYLRISTNDSRMAVLECKSGYYDIYNTETSNMYWHYLQLDRNLYRPDDYVNFWGLVKNRYENEEISSVTVEISQDNYIFFDTHYSSGNLGSRGYYPINDLPLVSEEVRAENGIFKGGFRLPNLSPGSYQLNVKKDGKVLDSTYLSVENFAKPAYRLEVSSDKKAVFLGEDINFNIKASFFEGTGVPKLDVSYNINSPGSDETFLTETTDSSGSLDVKYFANPKGSGYQGEHPIGLSARATLPEMGEISQYCDARLFINDINVDIATQLVNNKGEIKAQVNSIVLDRLNNGTAKDYNDFLGDPVKGKTLEGTIYKKIPYEVEDGKYYNYITKTTEKRYRTEYRKEMLKDFSMTTDSSGKALFTFDAPPVENNGYYTAVVKCKDNKGRDMYFEISINNYIIYDNYNEGYHLGGGSEKYKIGDTVKLTFMNGKKTMPQGKYLFIKAQNGLRSYETSQGPDYSFTVEEEDVPNVFVKGIYFDGISYIESQEFNALFDYKEKNLVLEASLDKPDYRPGEEVTIKINAKDKNNNARKAVVNASIVDESLFNLQEQYIDTLSALYSSVPSGIEHSYSSHWYSESAIKNRNAAYEELPNSEVWGGGLRTKITFSESTDAVPVRLNGASSADMNYAGLFFNEKSNYIFIKVREDFKDTASFQTIMLNDEGYGEIRFKLPDNITSWRVTLSGATPDLRAGSNKVSLNVSLPFFINHSLNTTYLEGDKPVLDVTPYGSSLKQDETVFFEVFPENDPHKAVKAQGKAFERLSIPLWELAEGKTDLIIKAVSSSGLKDSLKHTFTTVKTYHEVDEALYYDLKPGLKIKGGKERNTKLIFTDKGRGSLLNSINTLRYSSGNRLEQKLSAKAALEMLSRYYKLEEPEYGTLPFNPSDYQCEDGGLALLPYGSSDVEVSAKVSSLVKDDINAFKLRDYFYNCLYEDSPGVKGSALYGLSVLKEPILLNLNKASEVENISIKDILYIALAYCELGELPAADRLYTGRIAGYVESFKPFYRINTGKDNDDILECTSLAALLAAKLNKPHKEDFFRYCETNETKDILTSIERLLYIKEEIGKVKEGSASINYKLFGKSYSANLDSGEPLILTIPSEKLNELVIEGVKGDIGVVSMFRRPLMSTDKTDNNISVSRKYSVYNGASSNSSNTFSKDDIIKVELVWSIGDKAIDGSYIVTDYLPSGLKPIENYNRMGVSPEINEISYRETNGQQVTFYIDKKHTHILTYYARVISPGSYKADGTVIQSTVSPEILNLGKADNIEIK